MECGMMLNVMQIESTIFVRNNYRDDTLHESIAIFHLFNNILLEDENTNKQINCRKYQILHL